MVWDSFMNPIEEQQRVEVTSSITNRLLRYGIANRRGYESEVNALEGLFSGLPMTEDLRKGFDAMRIFIPAVPGEIKNRYDAVKHEINSAGLDNLVVGACGLSPVGRVFAASHPNADVYDTDLADIIEYRNSLNIKSPSNYQIAEWDLLSGKMPHFAGELKGKTGIVVEGLIFYLDDSQKAELNKNLQKAARIMSPTSPVTFVFDCYVADKPAKERDTLVMPNHPKWEYFKGLISNVHDGQKPSFNVREDVRDYLESAGYKNIELSSETRRGNAHTIWRCEF